MRVGWENSIFVCFFVCVCFRVCDRWKDIGTIAHNKSAITVEITSRDDTIIFHMVSVVSAGGLCAFTHTFYKVYSGRLHPQIPLQRDKYGGKFGLSFL